MACANKKETSSITACCLHYNWMDEWIPIATNLLDGTQSGFLSFFFVVVKNAIEMNKFNYLKPLHIVYVVYST